MELSSKSTNIHLHLLCLSAVVLCLPPAVASIPTPPFFQGYGYGGGFSYGYGNYLDNPWASFFNFTNCPFGQSQQGLSQIKQYLSSFGYLPSSTGFDDLFDDPFRSAILAYQEFFHLNATGELDPATLAQMVLPRCGVADRLGSVPGRNLYAFFPGEPKWPAGKSRLTYAFTSTSAVSIDVDVMRRVFARAFGRWAEVTTLTFYEVDSDPDIVIGFYSGDHGDGEPFDGRLGTLAHAFSPTDGRFHFDAAEMWVASAEDVAPDNLLQSPVAVDLESVAVHEIGHLLGLGHSSVDGSIMYPTIKTRSRRVELTKDDIEGIQKLYGNNPSYNGTSGFAGGTNTMAAGDNNSSPPSTSTLPYLCLLFTSYILVALLL